MQELLELVNTRISTMIDDGSIEKMIEERATKTVTEILDDAFRSYGKLRKALEEKIESGIDGSTFNFEIEPYTKVMNDMAQKQISSYLEKEAQAQIEKSISKIFKPIQSEVTLQELVTMIAESFKDDDYDNDRDDHLSMECSESDYGWYDLKFWKKKDDSYSLSSSRRERSPDVQIHVSKEGEIRWLSDGGRDYGAHKYGVEALLYRMTIKGTKITDVRNCDGDDFNDTYIGIGEDY